MYGMYIMGFGLPLLIMTFLLTQAYHYLKGRGVQGPSLNAFLFLVVLAGGGGLLMHWSAVYT